jgi:hypothetical protein
MTDAPSRTTEIAGYMAAVERHLTDLPEVIRQDLMSDLDTHLAEVAADLEDGVALSDLLGSPEAYARELRETAEIPRERTGDRLRRGLRETAEPLTRRVRAWADKYAVSTGHADAAEMRERLRPGWWVFRGVLAALLFLYLLAATQFNAAGYNPFGSIIGTLFAIALVLFCVWASMRIGARSREWGRRRRWWIGVVGVGLVVYGVAWPFLRGPTVHYIDEASYNGHITDIQVYDENGEPITGVYLFDQNGDPLWIGEPWECAPEEGDPFATARSVDGTGFSEADGRNDEPDPDLGYLYPICGAPTEAPTESASPSEPPTATDGPTPTDGPSATERPTGEETATPAETATPGDTPAPEETATP